MTLSSSPSQRSTQLVAACVFALCASAIYAHTLNYPFVFDDLPSIVQNPTLSADSIASALSPPDDSSVTGRPLVNLSFALNRRCFGASPVSFRATNVALHVFNAWLIFGLLMRLLPEVRRAYWALVISCLWLCHPLQTEAVIYVTQRTELAATLCLLLTVRFALRFMACTEPERGRWLLLATLACALGTGCKEILVAAPFCVLALDRCYFSERWRGCLERHGRLYLGLFIALLPLFLQVLTQPRTWTAGLNLGVSAWQALATSAHAIVLYLRLSAWPSSLSVTYNWSFTDALQRHALDVIAVALLGVVTLWALHMRRRSAALLVGFFAVLAPSTSIIPIISEVAAERRMYLALLAPIALCVLGVARVTPRVERFARVLCLPLVVVAAGAAYVRALDYRSPEALFGAALRVAPDNPQAMWGLASALAERGQFDAASALYERMAAAPYPYVGPASWGTRGLMAAAQLYALHGEAARAQHTRERALAHDPQSALGQLQTAAQQLATGHEAQALLVLEKLQTQPFLLERVHRELAKLYARRGDVERARMQLMAAERARR